jgi:arsenite methyltransferase
MDSTGARNTDSTEAKNASRIPKKSCCAAASSARPSNPSMPDTPDDIRSVVRDRYARFAEGTAVAAGPDSGPGAGACGCGCGDGGQGHSGLLTTLGYSADQAAAVPEGANLGLGCGNPLAHASLRSGETVLDLGSGAGIDCFLASREVGPTGRVIGVDMTPAMLDRARAAAVRAGMENVEFRLGEIENLPVADVSVDAIISNCVVNLSPDKPRVFREALRVLRPGGRLLLSDLVLVRELDEDLRSDVSLYVGCVAGASLREDYLRMIADAGFHPIEIMAEDGYDVGVENLPEGSRERAAFAAVRSVKIRAVKPVA